MARFPHSISVAIVVHARRAEQIYLIDKEKREKKVVNFHWKTVPIKSVMSGLFAIFQRSANSVNIFEVFRSDSMWNSWNTVNVCDQHFVLVCHNDAAIAYRFDLQSKRVKEKDAMRLDEEFHLQCDLPLFLAINSMTQKRICSIRVISVRFFFASRWIVCFFHFFFFFSCLRQISK